MSENRPLYQLGLPVTEPQLQIHDAALAGSYRLIVGESERSVTSDVIVEVQEGGRRLVVVVFAPMGNRGLLIVEEDGQIHSECTELYRPVLPPRELLSVLKGSRGADVSLRERDVSVRLIRLSDFEDSPVSP